MLDKNGVLQALENANNNWQASLQGALIGDIDFTNHIFETPALFRGAQFLGQANFSGATFKQNADFSGVRFAKPASFINCRFEKGGNFSLARFTKVDFFQSVFHDAARFWRAFFLDEADFAQIKVIPDPCVPANYESEANWSWARFAEKATFSYAEFHHPVYFYRTLFKNDVFFEECRFEGPLAMNGKQNEILISRFELINPDSIARLESSGLAIADTEMFRGDGNQRLSEFVFMNTVRSEPEFLEKLAAIENITDQEKGRLAAEWREGAQPMFQAGRLVSFRNAYFKTLEQLECEYVDFAKVKLDRDVYGSLEDRVAFENCLKTKTYDVFISHASEDKAAIARPLANKLGEMGYTVFLDERAIDIGAELLQSINTGISQSRVGVVLISPAFMEKKWTKYELDELLALSNAGGKKLLPLWYHVTEEELRKWSAPISNLVALQVDGGNIDEVAFKLAQQMG